jgi:hypothetical protein
MTIEIDEGFICCEGCYKLGIKKGKSDEQKRILKEIDNEREDFNDRLKDNEMPGEVRTQLIGVIMGIDFIKSKIKGEHK